MIAKLSAAVMLLCSTSSTCPRVFATPHGSRLLSMSATEAAREHAIDETELVALAWNESRFSLRALSHRDAFGIMQVKRFWMPRSRRCVNVTYKCVRRHMRSGAKAYAHYKRKCKTLPRAIRGYRSGQCGAPVATTRRVLRTLEQIRRM